MALRNIYTVNATQVVISESHPEGTLSNVSGFPKAIDSRSYNATEQNPNGDTDVAIIVAMAEFWGQAKAFATANNVNRKAWTVEIVDANGIQIARKSIGAFPDMTPAPAPEPYEAEEEQ